MAFVKILRNTSLYTTHDLAIEAAKTKAPTLTDGEIFLATYGNDWATSKSILCAVRQSGGYTIFDNSDVESKIAELDATLNHNGTHLEMEIVEVDGKLNALTVTEKDIASAALLGTAEDTSASATAFGKIAKEAEDRAAAITAAIQALDSSVAATAAADDVYSVLTGVTITDGKITDHTEVTLAKVAKTGVAGDVTATPIAADLSHVAIAGDNVSAQIDSIAKILYSIDQDELSYRMVQLSASETEALGANIKEAYQLYSFKGTWNPAGDKTAVGDVIKVYKDATLKSASFDNTKQALVLTYILADGTESVVEVPMTSIVLETEVEKGIQAVDGKLSIKLDANNESAFLTVGEGGLKLSGVQTAINTAVEGLDATVGSTEVATDKHVAVQVVETDGKLTGLTVTENDIASAALLGSKTDGKTAETAFGYIAKEADERATAITNAVAALDATVGSATVAEGKHVAVQVVETDGVLTTLTVAENDIASAALLGTATDASTATTAFGKIAKEAEDRAAAITTVNGAIEAETARAAAKETELGTAITNETARAEGEEAKMLTEIEGSNAISVTTKAEKKQTVSLILDESVKTGQGMNALSVTENGLYLSNVWDCGTY